MDPGPAATEQGPDIRDQGPGTSVFLPPTKPVPLTRDRVPPATREPSVDMCPPANPTHICDPLFLKPQKHFCIKQNTYMFAQPVPRLSALKVYPKKELPSWSISLTGIVIEGKSRTCQ
jgi:hypothetical protein